MSSAPAKTRVFISCTSEDLQKHRLAVRQKLLKFGFDPIVMEDFPAGEDAPVKVSIDRTKEADVFVGIYAWRYGSYVGDSGRSFIEYELDAAISRDIPRLFFLVDTRKKWDEKLKDTGEKAERLEKFKEKISRDRVVKPFSTPAQLADEVCRALVAWKQEELEKKGTGEQSPLQPELLQLLEIIERRAKKSLEERTASRFLDLKIKWRDRRRGPLGAEYGDDAVRSLPPEGLPELLRDHQRLLILGGPGAGKTIALNQLTLDLVRDIDRSADPLSGIPIPLSLSAWRSTDSDLKKWLVRESQEQLSLPPKIGRSFRSFLEEDCLVPLLDGLDEVAEGDRPACVEAIQRYTEKPGGPLVVSYRAEADATLPQPFHSHADVILQPVDEKSADCYLAQAGPELDVLRVAVREHERLRDLARTPLWLKLMSEAFEKSTAETLQELAASPAEELPRRVVKAYVDRMDQRMEELIERGLGSPEYLTGPTHGHLAWLARQMRDRDHGMKRFEIELLQPIWLPTLVERWLYAILTRGIVGGLLAAIPALRYECLLSAGLVAGALAGVVDALPVWRPPASNRPSPLVRQRAVRVLVIGAVSFTTFLQLSACISTPLAFSLLLGVVFGLFFGTRPGDLQKHTRVFERVTWKWSWKGGRAGALTGVLSTASLAGLAHVLPKEAGQMALFHAAFWVLVGALSGALGFLIGGGLGGLKGSTIERRRTPNVGFRHGLREIGKTVCRAAALTVPAGGVLGVPLGIGPGIGMLSGLLIALFAGLWLGGLDLLQHWTTRTLLSATGRFPWRWVRFLDHAAYRRLLYKIEGGYEFPHDVVRKYFSELSKSAEEAE